MRITRLYNDAAGESHFADVDLHHELRSAGGNDRSWFAHPLATSALELRDVLVENDQPALHTAPRRQFVLVLRGWFEVEASDGERRSFGPGDVLFVDDVAGQGHRFFGHGPDRRMAILPVADDFELPVATT